MNIKSICVFCGSSPGSKSTFELTAHELGLIIALHNNTNGRHYIEFYLKGGSLEKDARKSHHNPKLDSDDFFFTTNEFIFDYFKFRDYNVVLQSSWTRDDGSLLVYVEMNIIDCINVEGTVWSF